MSFYDDASLVFLPSGGAGKDGKAYSMKPIPEYGSELVTNGTFDTDSNWTKGTGWTISGGTANCDGTQTGNTLLYQNIGHSSNTLYRLQFTISNYVSGTIDFALDSPFFGAANSNGTFVFDITPTSGGNFIVRADENFVGSLDNVSVKEITTSGDFTFSRGSNLTATRVDSNGLIEKGRENLLLQSNQFDTTWVTSNTSVTSGQSGYDGSSDAWLLSNDASGGHLRQTKSVSGVNTFSFYAKANNSNWMALYAVGQAAIYFDLQNGAIGSGSTISSIKSIGNGWYRCSITITISSASFRIYPADADNVTSGTSGSIYIQDAQLEQGLVATEYIESGATKGKAGLLEQEPRFDYSGGASCPSLLLEPSRTQLVTQSEYLLGYFATDGTTLSHNHGTSPEGVQNSVLITQSGGVASNSIYNFNLPTTDGSYSYSFFFKAGTSTLCRFYCGTGVTENFNPQSVTAGYTGGALNLLFEDYGSGWWRVSATQTLSGASTNRFAFNPDFGNNGGNVEIYGFQAEVGSYPTSYIPNHSGGSVTRGADDCTNTSATSLIGQTEGTIYCEFEYNGAADSGVFNRIIGLGTGVTQNRILLAKNNTTAELVAFAVSGGTTQVFQAIAGTSIIGHHKVAISYKANEYKVYLDGELEFTDSSALVPATTDVYIGTAEDSTIYNELGGVVKQAIIFKEVLSEDNCKALTTI